MLIDDQTIEQELIAAQVKRRLRKRLNDLVDSLTCHLNIQDVNEIKKSCKLLREKIIEVETIQSGFFENTLINSIDHKNDTSSQWNKNKNITNNTNSFSFSFRGSDRISLSTFIHNLTSKSTLNSKDSILQNRIESVSRLLSTSSTRQRILLNTDLLAYIRAICLEIVRVKYWEMIQGGSLPRLSHSSQ